MIDVLVNGAAGRMGALTCATIRAADDLRLVAGVDPAFAPADPAAGRYASVDEALAAVRPQVAVDFTLPSVVFDTVSRTLAAGVPTVVGTTGLDDDRVAALGALAAEHGVALLLVPNFSLGAMLMMRFAAEAARHLPRGEIVESHEESKADAPSGTALRTARLMSAAGAQAPAGGDQARPSRGADEGGVRVHSVRLPGLVAHQEVVFGGAGETLTIRHDSLSRESFMPGMLLAVRNAPSLAGTVVGLENLLWQGSQG